MRDEFRDQRCGPRRQRGFTLIEVLLAMVLASLVVLGLAVGILTTLSASNAASARQRREVALTSFTESLKALPYVECTSGGATAHAYNTAYQAGAASGATWQPKPDAGVSDLDVVDVKYWQPAPAGGAAGTYATCGSVDQGAQRLSVSLRVDGEPVHGQVVIRVQS